MFLSTKSITGVDRKIFGNVCEHCELVWAKKMSRCAIKWRDEENIINENTKFCNVNHHGWSPLFYGHLRVAFIVFQIVVVLVNGVSSDRSLNWPHVSRCNYPLKPVIRNLSQTKLYRSSAKIFCCTKCIKIQNQRDVKAASSILTSVFRNFFNVEALNVSWKSPWRKRY